MISPEDNVSIKSMEFSPIIGVLQGSHKNDVGFTSSKKDIDEPLENVLETWNHDNRNERTIHNDLAKKVLEENLYNNQELLGKKILQFRKKKIIKTRVSKIYGFSKQEDSIHNQGFLSGKSQGMKYRYHEQRMLKKIKRSAILKRILNYWKDQSQNYPTIYKKIFFVKEEDQNYFEELTDLTKKQFDSLALDFVQINLLIQYYSYKFDSFLSLIFYISNTVYIVNP